MKLIIPEYIGKKIFEVLVHCQDGETSYSTHYYARAYTQVEASICIQKYALPKKEGFWENQDGHYEQKGDYRIYDISDGSSPNISIISGGGQYNYDINRAIPFGDFSLDRKNCDIHLYTDDAVEYWWQLPTGDFLVMNTSKDDNGGIHIKHQEDAQRCFDELVSEGFEVLKFFKERL